MENWVKLRRDCSPFEVFTKLRSEVKEDVRVRNQLRTPQEQVNFKFVLPDSGANNRFHVIREGPLKTWAALEFICNESGIWVEDNQGEHIQDATLTLTDEAECKIKLKTGEELTCWQFRKRALEDLFFKF